MIIVTSPLFILLAIIIKLESTGPVIYRQERVGLDGNIFEIFKFRSMRINAEEKTGPVWASDGDNRRTRLGTFLRRTSIDELPVLINVLRGEMSLVGPRPLPIKYFSRFNSFQLKRLNVKPGITGLAQINGRNLLSWDEKFRYDINYVNDYSFLLDIKIIFKTIIVLFFKKNVRAKDQEIMPEFMGSKSKEDKD